MPTYLPVGHGTDDLWTLLLGMRTWTFADTAQFWTDTWVIEPEHWRKAWVLSYSDELRYYFSATCRESYDGGDTWSEPLLSDALFAPGKTIEDLVSWLQSMIPCPYRLLQLPAAMHDYQDYAFSSEFGWCPTGIDGRFVYFPGANSGEYYRTPIPIYMTEIISGVSWVETLIDAPAVPFEGFPFVITLSETLNTGGTLDTYLGNMSTSLSALVSTTTLIHQKLAGARVS